MRRFLEAKMATEPILPKRGPSHDRAQVFPSPSQTPQSATLVALYCPPWLKPQAQSFNPVSHQRLTALKVMQSLTQNETIWVKCFLCCGGWENRFFWTSPWLLCATGLNCTRNLTEEIAPLRYFYGAPEPGTTVV